MLDCLVPASGVSEPGAILVKRKEKHSRQKTMLLVSGRMVAVPTSLPFPTVHFSFSISALRSDDTMESFARILLFSLTTVTALQEEAKSRVYDVDNAQLPAHSGLQLPVCNAQRVQRANGSALHPGRKNCDVSEGLWEL